MGRISLSLRSRIFLIVLIGAVLPLVLLSSWFNRTAQRSGEMLLRGRLEASLDEVSHGVGLRWLAVRSDILRVAESRVVQTALGGTTTSSTPPAVASASQTGPGAVRGRSAPFAADREFRTILEDLRGTVAALRILDAAGEPVWSGRTAGVDDRLPPPAVRVLPMRLGIYGIGSGRRLGTIEASVRLETLLSETATWSGVAGSVLGAFEPATGAALLPLSIDPFLLVRDRFRWQEKDWMSVRRMLRDPPVGLALAAPVTPFVEPFRESARRNLWILAGVTLLVLGLATVLTRRTTRDLRRLAAGAEAVARGDLKREVEATGDDEVGRVGRAFNVMTASLRSTLDQLSRRQALAAVGEFAASLAHEVRNPLTSIRLDLQRVEEMTPDDGDARMLVARTLRRIDGLDRSVGGALQVARSGRVALEPLDLRGPLNGAVQVAQPTFATAGAVLEAKLPDQAVEVEGDAVALERLFVNLLLNAGQALERGGRATLEIDDPGEGEIHVRIRDEGPGIPAEDIEHVFEPFYSTRAEGTGLGLPIARQIARAHGGELELRTGPGKGTMVTVRLPRASAARAQ
ncbi:MAG: ATP-binding protein [Gemmatimonadota bacterium]